MKKIGYILFAAMGLASCSNDEIFEATANVAEESAQEVDFSRRSYSEALQIAQNSIAMIQDSAAVTRGEEVGRTLNLESGVKTYCQKATRANGASANDTLIYVFNFNDNKGFAVVSANRATEGLLAVVENGNYDPNSKWIDSYALECLENAKEYVANAVDDEATNVTRAAYDNNYHPIYMYPPTFDTIYHKKSDDKDFIQTKWGQTGVTGEFCPVGKIAGSGSIAAAQVMAFCEYPKNSIVLTYGGNVNVYLNWKGIKDITNTDKLPEQHKAVCEQLSHLVREIGYRAGATYMSTCTSVPLKGVRSALKSFGYTTSDFVNYNYSDAGKDLGSRLKHGCFAIMYGDNGSASHTFIIDGGEYTRCYERRYADMSNGAKHVLDDATFHQTNKNHINWGEGGKYDGWFSSNVFAPKTHTVNEGSENRKTTFDGKSNQDFSRGNVYFIVSH